LPWCPGSTASGWFRCIMANPAVPYTSILITNLLVS
jgi:hypothetical protein